MYTDQLKSSQDYSTLNKAIGIHILNFVSITDNQKYHNVFRITEQESGLPYFRDLELHTVELTKFSKDPDEDLNSLLKKIKTSLDIWTAFLTRNDLLNKDNLPEPLAINTLKKALHVLDTLNLTDEERMAYEDHLKWLRIEANTVEKYRKEGEQKGIRMGQEQGKLEGEKEKAISIARAMLKDGFQVEKVMLFTGLSKSDIQSIV